MDYAEYVDDLIAKIDYLVAYINKFTPLEDGGFTFPNGDHWTLKEKN
jgi:hypothetical protein